MPYKESTIDSTTSILCVDESGEVLSIAETYGLQTQYQFFNYHVEHEALTHLATSSVDIVIYDVRSSAKNDIEFIKRVKEFCPDATRILLGNSAHQSIGIDAIAYGFVHYYLLEPWGKQEIKALIVNAARLHTKLRSQHLKSLLPLFTNLPSPPKYYSRVRELINDPTKSLSALAEEIEKNPPLVAKALQVSNSAYFGARYPILTTREAVAFLGTKQIGILANALDVFQKFTQGVDQESLDIIEKIWEEGLRRAGTAKAIAEEWQDAVEPHEVFVASLLQDVGYLVRLCSDPEGYSHMTKLKETEGISKYEADLRVFDVTHDEVGAALLEFWNFPREIVFAVANHHSESFNDPLTIILQIAEAIETTEAQYPCDHSLDPLIEEWREKIKALSLVH